MDICIFCKIVTKEVPNYKVYEDEYFLGFLDVYPISKGHTLLVPKKHYRWTHDVENFGAYWEAAKVVALKLQKALGASWIQFVTHGQIPHAHIHIIPRYDDVKTAPQVANGGKTLTFSKEEFGEILRSLDSTPSLTG